ncbi:DNA integrity scanning protein DisA [Candidatus Pacearchaeota archaeon CG10_big_fil_rev_8_21_14_0_10_32_42]|nr:MAG: DNA integrity scanning protein DisA [Candidatus Pacearchaeota archaeon CG10_big_fil_rev_8_21_14_0_10_32_42]
MTDEIEKTEEIFLPFSKENSEGESGKDFMDVLRMVAPGTSLRVALDDFLNAKMGALIVLDNGNLESIVEGGFTVNTKFSAQKLVELAKMDGAIILSKDAKEIIRVNTLLFADISINTKETGTRHKAAERTAKQAKTVAIAVSERKNKISIYYGDSSYQLQRSSEVLRRASETLQILEKQRDIFNGYLSDLNSLELRKHSTINDVCLVLQRVEIMKRISDLVQRLLIELGKEGIVVKMRLKELMGGLQKEEDLILRDYFGSNHTSSLEILEKMDFDFLLEPLNISRLLFEELHDKNVSPKGIRLLGKTNLLERYMDLLVGNFENLSEILSAENEEILRVLGSESMLAFFKEEIYTLKEKVNLGKGL